MLLDLLIFNWIIHEIVDEKKSTVRVYLRLEMKVEWVLFLSLDYICIIDKILAIIVYIDPIDQIVGVF